MKKFSATTLLKITLISAFMLISFLAIKYPAKIETNLLTAITSNSQQDQQIIRLSQKHAGIVNVIFEAEDMFLLSEVKNKFINSLDKKTVIQDITQTYMITDLLNTYKVYSNNLLAPRTAKKIKSGNFKDIKLESLQRLYDPLSMNILPIEEDPFLFFSDYLQSIENPNSKHSIQINDKYYESISISLVDRIALSPTLLNKEIKKLISLKNEIEKTNPYVKIKLAGTPIHTYYASSASIKEINIICILSSLFIILLCRFYFKSFKILIPIGTSLLLGMLVGYMTTRAFFSTIHVLTFVFSTTLIGICVDYSLHYFAKKDDAEPLLKSLTIGMTTTVLAFGILLFSRIDLLKQIAIFTSAGLISVYIYVILFFPYICEKLNINLDNKTDLSPIFNYKPSAKTKISILVFVSVVILIGCSQLKFNDSIKDMYKPTKQLLATEKLLTQINGNNDIKFILVNAENIENLLQKEEKIADYLPTGSFYALSLLLPSEERQKENQKLRQRLYKYELNNYANFLSPALKQRILKEKTKKDYLSIEKLPKPITSKFLLDNNTSVMFVKNANVNILKNFKDISIVDLQNDISKRITTCRKNCIKLILPIFIGLFTLLTIIYKNPTSALKIVSSPLLGCLFTLGILGIFHQNINFFNVLALFLIMGFSLDYSVFRFNASKKSIDSNAAVLISCATSVFSFLLLSMTSFKLISSLGLVLALGLTSSYIFSLFLISKE